jgi:hypothetical protein
LKKLALPIFVTFSCFFFLLAWYREGAGAGAASKGYGSDFLNYVLKIQVKDLESTEE